MSSIKKKEEIKHKPFTTKQGLKTRFTAVMKFHRVIEMPRSNVEAYALTQTTQMSV